VTTSPVRNISWRGERLLPDPIDGDALRYTPILPAHVDAISVHHTTGPGLPATATEAQEIAYLRDIDTYHRTQRGLDAIGYQLVAFASGRVYVAAPLDRYGAAVALHNNHTLSIALPGDFTTDPPTPAHLNALARAIAHVDAYLYRPVSIYPHRHWGGTACPGNTYSAWPRPLRQTEDTDMGMTPAEAARLAAVEGKAHVHTTPTAPPPPPPPPAPAPRTYTVRASDGAEGLSAIALRQLGNAARWPEIATLNGIAGPRYIIHTGQVLRLP